MAILPKERAKTRLSSTSASKAPKPVKTGASSSGTTFQPVAAGREPAYFMKRGPPKVPRITEALDQRKRPGETDQEHKCRLVGERYSLVQGETEEEVEMVDLFKQVLAADSRGVISSFVLSIFVSRYWGKDNMNNDASLVSVAKTENS